MPVQDIFLVAGFLSIGISAILFLRELFLLAIQHGYSGIAIFCFFVGLFSLIIGGILEPTPNRPRPPGRRR